MMHRRFTRQKIPLWQKVLLLVLALHGLLLWYAARRLGTSVTTQPWRERSQSSLKFITVSVSLSVTHKKQHEPITAKADSSSLVRSEHLKVRYEAPLSHSPTHPIKKQQVVSNQSSAISPQKKSNNASQQHVAPTVEEGGLMTSIPSPTAFKNNSGNAIDAKMARDVQASAPASSTDESLHNEPPLYPALSRKLGEQGKVLLKVLVAIHGAPIQVELLSSSGYDRLDQAAIRAAKSWRYVPAVKDGKKQQSWLNVPFSFVLESKKDF